MSKLLYFGVHSHRVLVSHLERLVTPRQPGKNHPAKSHEYTIGFTPSSGSSHAKILHLSRLAYPNRAISLRAALPQERYCPFVSNYDRRM